MRIVVLGSTGFIGTNLVSYLKEKGHWVRGADIKRNEFGKNDADEFILCDLRNIASVQLVIDDSIDEVYQLAADMGGAQYVFSKMHDADIVHNSVLINVNVAQVAMERRETLKRLFYSSSACVYPEHNQLDPNNPHCEESSAYPANPDSAYGKEKLFSECLYDAFARNYGIEVHIARFHNIFGPWGTYRGGREKAPAAMCRKVIEAQDNGFIEVWGDGLQTRSFLYIDECIEGIYRFMHSDFYGPVNIGSEELISINDLAKMVIEISGKNVSIKNIPTDCEGVRGRNSHNALIMEKLEWSPTKTLKEGMIKVYEWIYEQMK